MPDMKCSDFFHSRELMQIYEHTKRHRPYMAVLTDSQGIPVAHMLSVVRNGKCRIFGEGEYALMDPHQREHIFGQMLNAITERLKGKVFYIEVSDISTKMFAYKHFRRNKFFPIHWLQVYNSLHSRAPEERVSRRLLSVIAEARSAGIETRPVTSDSDLDSFYQLLRTRYNVRPRMFCPVKAFFSQLQASNNAQLFITTQNGKTVGAIALVRSQGNAYLWFGAYRKTRNKKPETRNQNPLRGEVGRGLELLAIWDVINHEYRRGTAHFHFIDVGLPFVRNTYYDKIIQFGGRTVGAYRWFRFFPGILNSILRLCF